MRISFGPPNSISQGLHRSGWEMRLISFLIPREFWVLQINLLRTRSKPKPYPKKRTPLNGFWRKTEKRICWFRSENSVCVRLAHSITKKVYGWEWELESDPAGSSLSTSWSCYDEVEAVKTRPTLKTVDLFRLKETAGFKSSAMMTGSV